MCLCVIILLLSLAAQPKLARLEGANFVAAKFRDSSRSSPAFKIDCVGPFDNSSARNSSNYLEHLGWFASKRATCLKASNLADDLNHRCVGVSGVLRRHSKELSRYGNPSPRCAVLSLSQIRLRCSSNDVWSVGSSIADQRPDAMLEAIPSDPTACAFEATWSKRRL